MAKRSAKKSESLKVKTEPGKVTKAKGGRQPMSTLWDFDREFERAFEDFFSRGWLRPSRWELPRAHAAVGDKLPNVNVIDRESDVVIEAQMRNDEFEVPPTSGGEVTWEGVIYDLVVTNTVDNSSVRYRASADITFRLDGTDWYVYLWEDKIGESPPEGGAPLQTMGVLRGTFGSNP